MAALNEHVDVPNDEVHELTHVQREDTIQDDWDLAYGTVETPDARCKRRRAQDH